MKLIFTQKEVEQFVKEKVSELSPEGQVPVVNIRTYSEDWCTVKFKDAEPKTATEADNKNEDSPELPPEDKPIPF